MTPHPAIPTSLQAPASFDRMLDGILRTVERVMDKPRRKSQRIKRNPRELLSAKSA